MTWMNEYEIEEALRYTAINELPNLRRGAEVLSALKEWTNDHSDGWPYWQKPARAANKLMDHLQTAMRKRWGEEEDITDAELKAALSPIKAFLTRQGVEHNLIFKVA
jgi:hypothetical protein